MKKNMGTADRLIRIVIAAIISFLNYNETLTGTIGIVSLIVAAALLITSFFSFCGLYTLFGINTCKVKPKQQ
jgi:uncharacterized membrane protein HdeD (DUF308 family)